MVETLGGIARLDMLVYENAYEPMLFTLLLFAKITEVTPDCPLSQLSGISPVMDVPTCVPALLNAREMVMPVLTVGVGVKDLVGVMDGVNDIVGVIEGVMLMVGVMVGVGVVVGKGSSHLSKLNRWNTTGAFPRRAST